LKTEILSIDPLNIDIDKIRFAANVLKKGGLVVFPTETVYGLGANALNEEAVKNIFKAKGRPSDNPLIVHVAYKEHLEFLAKEVNTTAHELIEKFWPGPLTMVMKKSSAVPYSITAGLDTVALRMPSHPVALSLIYEADIPVAAPSANRSGRPSPTKAEHVIEDLNGLVDVIIDSGSCKVGLESTVIDTISVPPIILRPGGITIEELQLVISNVNIDQGIYDFSGNIAPRSPGMKYTHYSPEAEVVVVSGNLENVIKKILELAKKAEQENKKTGILATNETLDSYKELNSLVFSVGTRVDMSTIAANLFDVLRTFDENKIGIVFAEAVDENGLGMAIMNRMTKASGYNIVYV
jgi:L-threonylcarbamoyladenylate synthase